MKPISAVGRVGFIRRRGGDQKPLLATCFPRVLQVAVPPGPFVAKVSGKDILAFAEQLDTILLSDFLTIDFLAATVPNTENDPALGLGIDLHSEVAAVPSTGHVKRPDRLFDTDDFGVERVDFFVFGRRIHQVH